MPWIREIDRTARLTFHNTVSAEIYSILCVENYIRKVLFYCVFSDVGMLGVKPVRVATTRDGLLLYADRPHRHGRLSSLDMPG